MLRQLLQSAVGGAERVADDMGLAESLPATHPVLQRLATNHVPKLLAINTTTRERLRDQLATSIANGESIPEQREIIQEVFKSASAGRTMTIARTENTTFWQAGGHQQMIDGGAIAHLWITTRDTRRRPSHVTMEGQCQPIHLPFISGAGVRLMHPGDPSAPIEEIANCRCVEAPLTQGCEGKSLHFATEARRTLYWKSRIRLIEQAEQRVAATMRAIFGGQQQDVLAAFDAIAG